MKLLQGYVENRTKEIALTALFCSLFIILREFKLMIVPGVYLRVAGTFLYIAAAIISWKFTWVLILVATVTAWDINPIRAFCGLTVSIQTVYFLSRQLHGSKKVLSIVVATYIGNFVGNLVNYLMGFFPFEVAILSFIPKATLTAISAPILAIPIWKALEDLDLVSFEDDKNV